MNVFELLAPEIQSVIKKMGFERPTEPQAEAIPLILQGKNVLLIGPTGAGKTEAAIFPIFDLYLKSKDKISGIGILYITPLRALNRDLLRRLEWLGKELAIPVMVRHGDTSVTERRAQAQKPPAMLITTPETLQAILPGKILKEYLRGVRWLIIDEIHELAEDERGAQLSIALERLRELTGKEFQRIGLSATIGTPEIVAKFLVGTDRTAEIVKISTSHLMELKVESPSPTSDDRELAPQLFTTASAVARIRSIKELIEKHTSILTFVNTREMAEILGSRIKFWDQKFPLEVHHSSLSRESRVSTEEAFKSGMLKGIIATSSMELGIDVGSVDLAIQYMSPHQVVRLVQRVGRSGHKVGLISKGVIIATEADDILEAAVVSRKAKNEELEPVKTQENALDALAHQVVGLAIDFRRLTLDKALQIIRRAYPFRALDKQTLASIVKHLSSQFPSILFFDGVTETFSIKRGGWKYYYGTLSMIPDEKRYLVINLLTKTPVGSFDEAFVANYIQPNVAVICRGQPWRVVGILGDKIQVEPINDPTGAIPSWIGEEIPVPFEVAQEVGRLRGFIGGKLKEGIKSDGVASELFVEYSAEKHALKKVISLIQKQLNQKMPVPTDKQLLIEAVDRFVIINSCFGTLTNETLGRLIAILLTARFGSSVGMQSDPYRITLELPVKADLEIVKELLFTIKPSEVEPIIRMTLKQMPLLRWRLVHVGRKFGAIEKEVDYDKVSLPKLLRSFENTPIYWEAVRESLERLDVKKTEEILELIQNNKIEIITASKPTGANFSPISLVGVDQLIKKELLVPERAERAILKALKHRLLNEKVKLLCVYCGQWTTTMTIKNLDERPSCQKCSSRLLAALRVRDVESEHIVKKYKSKKGLSQEERKNLRRIWQNAQLVLSNGKQAIIAMAGHGVGPETATRILGHFHRSEDEFYRDILNAEKIYVQTRRFWR
ncbi:MAG: DEAD/DEAH box helicase [Euryarchaeota archaeon]|nr:DEAD/DEAH box helicase [Euryarchaeota archaeon]